MLGIDIYRKYQTVTDAAAVVRAGVRFAWFKGTDGGGLPPGGPADREVSQLGSRIPVGLYHYAQLGDPEEQARVLAAEVHRLRANGLPPALDLEDPHTPGSAAAIFARRFLTELKRQGFPRVALYASTSMLTGIRADDIRRDIDGVVIWAARYGSNDGLNHGLGGYTGHVDVHQFTSAGRVAGITGSVDLNNATDLQWAGQTEEDDVSLTPDQANKLEFIYSALLNGGESTPSGRSLISLIGDAAYGHAATQTQLAAKSFNVTPEQLDELAEDIAARTEGVTADVVKQSMRDVLLHGVDDTNA